ncbi:MAG: acyl-CoA reductase, partial [Thermofilaceae archaeon]
DVWREKLEAGKLDWVKEELVKATGYSSALIELEMRLAGEVLNPQNIRKLFDSTLIGGSKSLEEPVEVVPGEYIRNLPAGPILVIGSGNSLIPPLIPATISLSIGNFTVLRPSLTNFRAVKEVYSELENLPEDNFIRQALLVSYFTHESETFRGMLEKAPLGVVNYWGGEPGRTVITRAVSLNPHHPKLVVNGPMTGFAVIDSENATKEVAERLALEMILYEQQLCSSPTQAAFIGSYGDALEFAGTLSGALDRVGREYPLTMESIPYPLFVLRRSLELVGAKVYASNDPRNPWTVVLNRGKSALGLLPQNAIIPLHARGRFLEIIVVESLGEAMELARNLPKNPAYIGVDRVQTLSVAVSREALREITGKLHLLGVYRVVPLGESYMRTPVEPYDGFYLAPLLSYTAYIRVRSS